MMYCNYYDYCYYRYFIIIAYFYLFYMIANETQSIYFKALLEKVLFFILQ